MKLSSSASLSLTSKGVEEALGQVHKINERMRSVLILLGTPQTVEQVVNKKIGSLNQSAIIQLIIELINGGFVAKDGGTIADRVAVSSSGEVAQVVDEFVLSEAKFLLIDFCVDSFEAQAQTYIDQVEKCSNQASLKVCLKNIHEVIKRECKDRLPELMHVIAEINKTAD